MPFLPHVFQRWSRSIISTRRAVLTGKQFMRPYASLGEASIRRLPFSFFMFRADRRAAALRHVHGR